jgi:hypothetical protein
MSMRVGVLSSENSTHGVDAVKVSGNGHLLVQLRRLGQVGRSFEVGNLNETCTSITALKCDKNKAMSKAYQCPSRILGYSPGFCYTVYNSPKFNGFINCTL